MEALQQVVDGHGVNFMATICAICKAQFTGAALLRLRDEHGRAACTSSSAISIRLGNPTGTNLPGDDPTMSHAR